MDQETREAFAALGAQIAAMDQRFVSMDQRFESIDQRFVSMDQRFDSVEARLDEQRRHVGVLFETARHDVQVVAEMVVANTEAIVELRRRLDAV